jgi:hypothetical protein
MKQTQLILLLAVVLLLLVPTLPTAADAAPPGYAQGASVETSESATNVQMVSENVLLTVESRQDETLSDLAASYMIGRVEATFTMRNQGTEEESFTVWFPLAGGDYLDGPIENFATWVNDVPAVIDQEKGKGPWKRSVPWATWSVTFPPGQDVVLRVAYDALPIGYFPYGTFSYILETGAGWHGPIGEGTVTIRFPHEINESNTVLGGDELWGSTVLPSPGTFTLSGNEAVWHFTDLDPTGYDNIRLTFMAPQVWEEITAAQRDVATNPTSLEAYLRLACALEAALWFKDGLLPIGDNVALAESAKAAYERALELAPNDVTIHVEYLHLLWNCTGWYDPLPENFRPTLKRALKLAPDDKRPQRIQNMVIEKESFLDRRSATAIPTYTPVPMPSPESVFQVDPTVISPTTLPPATIQSSVASSPAPTLTPTPSSSPVATPIATPSQEGRSTSMTPLLVLCAVLGVLFVGWRATSLQSKR